MSSATRAAAAFGRIAALPVRRMLSIVAERLPTLR
jgi:hypothetical protein